MTLVVNGLNEINGISCLPADGAFYAYANIRPLIRAKGLKSCTEFSEWLLEETGVAVVPGDAFGLGGFMRISYATADDVLVDALGVLKKQLTQLMVLMLQLLRLQQKKLLNNLSCDKKKLLNEASFLFIS
jgi:aspartate/methionine/tyrosine aminotransferase